MYLIRYLSITKYPSLSSPLCTFINHCTTTTTFKPTLSFGGSTTVLVHRRSFSSNNINKDSSDKDGGWKLGRPVPYVPLDFKDDLVGSPIKPASSSPPTNGKANLQQPETTTATSSSSLLQELSNKLLKDMEDLDHTTRAISDAVIREQVGSSGEEKEVKRLANELERLLHTLKEQPKLWRRERRRLCMLLSFHSFIHSFILHHHHP